MEESYEQAINNASATATEEAVDTQVAEDLGGETTPPIQEGEQIEGKTEDGEAPPSQEPPADQEVDVVIADKTYTMKQSELRELLDNREKLTERERSMNKDYTQKTQALAAERKVFEEAFNGKVPEAEELKALGQIYQLWYSDPQAQNAIRSILSGTFDVNADSLPTKDTNISRLEREIGELKSVISQSQQAQQQREIAAALGEADKEIKSWQTRMKSEKNITVTDEQVDDMAHLIEALSKKHNEWSDQQILDKAWEYANIDNVKKDARKQILVSADRAKEKTPPRITSKAGTKPESEMSYEEAINQKLGIA